MDCGSLEQGHNRWNELVSLLGAYTASDKALRRKIGLVHETRNEHGRLESKLVMKFVK